MSPTVRPKPIIHGRDHLPGGADPIPGVTAGVDIDDIILATNPDAFWKLDELSGNVAHDSSGNSHDLTSPGGIYDPPTWGQPAGPPGTTSAQIGVETRVRGTLAAYTDNFTAGIWFKGESVENGELLGQGKPFHSSSGWTLGISHHGPSPGGWYSFVIVINGNLVVIADNPYANETPPTIIPPPVVGDEPPGWWFVAVVRDAGTWKLYVNGLLQADTDTTSPTTSNTDTWIGNDGQGSADALAQITADLSYGFIVNRVLHSSDLLAMYNAAINPAGEPPPPPGSGTIEYGNQDPGSSPVTGPPGFYTGTPASPAGWHYPAHFETAVLYDSSPARFDVPSRTWTRVPFNTVRLQRRFETAVGGGFTDAFLPDDRGLTQYAEQGLLHITEDMLYGTGPLTVRGWFAIEYPALDWLKLPNSPPAGGTDTYVRSARFMNVSRGYVMRNAADPTLRQFPVVWPFQVPAEGNYGLSSPNDNPFPWYPHWPARPLHKPLPYPKMSPTESRLNYLLTDPAGYPGFSLEHSGAVIATSLQAGDNLCLQAWQDTPWPLQFMTNSYPNVTPPDYVEAWRQRPCLIVEYSYDPETIDHTTGALL